MFLPDDFDILLAELEGYDSIVFCPNVLTEASNLSRYVAEPHRRRISATFANLVSAYAEDFVSSQSASSHPSFARLGLTDAVLLTLAARGATLLTTDLDLHLAAVTSGHASVNFNFVRDQYLN